MEDDEKVDELMEIIARVEKQISWLSDRLSFYEDTLKKCGLMSSPTIDEEEIQINSEK
jgi:hypothetical protein